MEKDAPAAAGGVVCTQHDERSAHRIAVHLCGLRVAIAASDADLLAALTVMLPPGWTESLSSTAAERTYCATAVQAGSFEIYADDALLRRCATLAEIARVFESDLQIWVAEMAPARVFVHAGVVGWRGRAIVIPGRSYSGKTTLVAALIKAGATYYSDEFAVFDADGRVHPFPRPLTIRAGGARRRVAADELGASRGTEPLRVGLVVVTEYRRGSAWRPLRLSGGKALLAVAAHSVSIRRQPAVVMKTLSLVTQDAAVIESRRGEADETCTMLFEELAKYSPEYLPFIGSPLEKQGECHVT